MPFVKTAHSRILQARDSYWPPNIRGGADIVAFRQWQRELKDARQRFLDEPPLRAGKQYTLTVSVPLIAQDSHSRRALPQACAAGNVDVTVTLCAPLAGSPLGGELSELPGRVWRATTPGGEDVVVKFYYSSLFIPEKPHAPSEKGGDFVLPRQYGLAEELAYDTLRSAQGRWLPYFLGRTEVSLSNGEIADVALFEYIPGRELGELQDQQWARDADTGEDVPHDVDDSPNSHFQVICQRQVDWFVRLRAIITEMHTVGIAHLDLNGRNILVPNSDPDGFVLIDFETARDDFAFGPDLRMAVWNFMCCGNHQNALWKWCKDNNFDTLEWTWGWPTNKVRQHDPTSQAEQ